MKQANEQSGKPIFLVSNRQGTGSDPLVAESTHAGMPIIDGVYSFLAGVRCMHNFRDFLSTKGTINEELPRSILEKYKQDLSERSSIGESEALKMFAELGINSNESHIVGDRDQLIDQSRSMQFPLVLKTALEEALHKSELDGVFLAINSEEQLLESYDKLQQKLPGDALLAPMIESDGVEMILGMITDKQLGPMVTIGFGGYYAEALNDAATLMPPFSNNKAKQAIESLKMKTMLEGYRGSDPVDIDAFAQMASRFSLIAVELQEQICEIDINPVILGKDNCIAVDALISLHQQNN
jgi:acyl-CoA synthetase (NDP forming)